MKLWQTARATSAAPTYFDALKVDGYAFIDGGLGANNPLGWLWTEALSVFGPLRPSDCILSIGTGIPPNKKLDGLVSLMKDMSEAATNTQLTHILFRTLIDAYAPNTLVRKYWRLNVGKTIGEDEGGKLEIMHQFQNWTTIKKMPDFIKEVEPYILAQKDATEDIAKALLAHLSDTSYQSPINLPAPCAAVIKVS